MELRSIHVNDTADRQYITLAEKLDGEATEPKSAGSKGSVSKEGAPKSAATKGGSGSSTSGSSATGSAASGSSTKGASGGGGGAADGARTLTIVIGWNEVQAVDRFVKGVRPPRPLTHELLASVVEASGAVLDRVDVTELKEGTFYAVLRLTRADGSAVDVDARPSDALALATALGKPIYVAEAVIEAARED